MPVLPVGWTLSYEMYFYLVFAITMLLSRSLFLPVIALWMLGSVLIGVVWDLPQPVLKVVTSPLLVEFLMGCLIGVWYKTGANVSVRVAYRVVTVAVLFFLAMIVSSKSQMPRVVAWGVPAALLIYGLVFLEKQGALKVPQFLVVLGNSSYSLYLSHLFAIHGVLNIWLKFIGKAYFDVFTFVVFAASLILAYISYRIVEMPAINILGARYRSYRARSSSFA